MVTLQARVFMPVLCFFSFPLETNIGLLLRLVGCVSVRPSPKPQRRRNSPHNDQHLPSFLRSRCSLRPRPSSRGQLCRPTTPSTIPLNLGRSLLPLKKLSERLLRLPRRPRPRSGGAWEECSLQHQEVRSHRSLWGCGRSYERPTRRLTRSDNPYGRLLPVELDLAC